MKRDVISTAEGVWVSLADALATMKHVELEGKALPLSTQAKTDLRSLVACLGPQSAGEVRVHFQPAGTGHTACVTGVKAREGSEALQRIKTFSGAVAGAEFDAEQTRELLGKMRGHARRLEQAAGWVR